MSGANDRAAPVLLTALLTLNACATSGPTVHEPVGARVVPVHSGIEMETLKSGSRRVYVWHVHDYDGTNHVLTWDDGSRVAQEVLPKVSACIHADCADLGPTAAATCSHPAIRPQLFHALHACADSSGMADYHETTERGATEYYVLIVTGTAATYMAAGDIQLSASLGARRKVTSVSPADTTIVGDVASCLKSSAAQGVIEPCRNSFARCTTIKPMLDRFDSCLRSHAYTVDASGGEP